MDPEQQAVAAVESKSVAQTPELIGMEMCRWMLRLVALAGVDRLPAVEDVARRMRAVEEVR